MRTSGIDDDQTISALQSSTGLRRPDGNRGAASTATPSFHEVLRNSQTSATPPLTFSAHAQARLASRNISLSANDLSRINSMADRVAQKGGKQALFLVNTAQGQQSALVVSIKNRVVITAVDGASMRDNLFTNIDSAAIV